MSLAKGRQRYVFRYSSGQEADVLAALVRLAQSPETNFDWVDAAVLSYEMGRSSGALTDRHAAISMS